MTNPLLNAPKLHIVEPTLNSDAGHCMSLVRALSAAAESAGCPQITVWGGRTATASGLSNKVSLEKHFVRRWRRFQALALYRRLLRQPGRILVSTAGSADLVSLDWAARSCGVHPMPKNKVTLFVHWLNVKPGKARLFSAIASRQPGIQILAPTASVVDFFSNCGFTAKQVAYPLDTASPEVTPPASPKAFRHILVPGAARMDKGFGHIVDLVLAMHEHQLTLPIIVQTSMEHGHQKDQTLVDAIARLRTSGYPYLTMQDEAMDHATYRALFDGAIVLQPYRAHDFKDRVSGVTLDAFQAGAPIVVTEDTWMSRLVQQHKAGVATSDLSATGLLGALTPILNNHEEFAQRAVAASTVIRAEHSAKGLIEAVVREG